MTARASGSHGTPRSEDARRRRVVEALRAAVAAVLVAGLAGCAAPLRSVVAVGGGGDVEPASASRVLVDPAHPVIVHAVDAQRLPTLQVSSQLRSITYLLRPGVHELWVSSAPYGLPFAPQRMKCFVMRAAFSPATEHRLRFDTVGEVPVLSSSGAPVEGVQVALVDQPLLLARGCRWP